MDQSLTESDQSISPSQILERLEMLRKLQNSQRGKLQKQRLEYQESPENSSVVTEFVSHFTNSTSYNTFRSLLQSSNETSKCSPRPQEQNTGNILKKLQEIDLVDGVSVLNFSQESDCLITSPPSSRSRVLESPNVASVNVSSSQNSNKNSACNSASKKQIELDGIPILTQKKDFETIIIEKLQIEMQKKIAEPVISKNNKLLSDGNKKPFLRRGEGMARFGLKKNDLIIQNTKALPWKRKSIDTKARANNNKINSEVPEKQLPKSGKPMKPLKHNEYKVNVEILVPPQQSLKLKSMEPLADNKSELKTATVVDTKDTESTIETVDSSNCEIHAVKTSVQRPPQGIHPLKANKGKTWAAVLTKEQDDFLRQLKQSDYYKNFASPAKSVVSDISCDENITKLRQEREVADQKMFDLLENKVTHESFSMENSFFNRFLKRNQLECSGESTPMILQKCLARNPNLMHIFPGLQNKKTHEETHSDVETCDSNYTDCDHESCSSETSCSSCKTFEEKNQYHCMQEKTESNDTGHKNRTKKFTRTKKDKPNEKDKCQDSIVTENATMKADMAEMNAKLAATSELLKDRLKELEDEIETFRKENTNLAKMREEVDLERQKFYEEKATFEQKYNEEKILSEYYLAEEKDKLAKQKQVYERYVREMRGRLNKKEKDEVISLKNEISDLKEEIRVKDAKSTSCIARLRNQLKIMEKEKTNFQGEVEKLKKENRRLHHSNEMTRRMTNIKYLQEINKKLTSITSKETQSEVKTDGDIKYKAFEIERQSRSRKLEPTTNKTVRPRSKSVPNLKVTSRYAKYFSQRDALSQMDEDKDLNIGHKSAYSCKSDGDEENNKCDVDKSLNLDDSASEKEDSENEVQNNLEKLYTERFKCISPHSSTSSLSKSSYRHSLSDRPDTQTIVDVNTNGFFLGKSNFCANLERNSKSPNERSISPCHHTCTGSNRSKSPVSVLSHRSNRDQQSTEHLTNHSSSNSRPKSPISILSNRSSGSQRSSNEYHHSDIGNFEPSCSKTSLTKTSLNPTEIKKPDGSRELRFPNGNVKHISADGRYTKFIYYNGDIKENFYNEGRIKYFYAETKTYHTTHADGLEVLEFPDGQTEKRYKDGSSEVRLPNGSVRYQDPKNRHVREEWRFPDGTTMTVSATGEQRVVFSNGQLEVHAKDHKRREYPDGTVKLVYNDGTSETRYSSGRVRIKDKHGNLIMDSAPG